METMKHKRHSEIDRILYILSIMFYAASPKIKLSFQTHFALITYVLLRQRQLAGVKFISCSHEEDGYEEVLKKKKEVEQCNNLINLIQPKDLDPDRVIWISEHVLKKYLIGVGQWVRISKFDKEDDLDNEFKCVVLPIPRPQGIQGDEAVIRINNVAEYNLRKCLNIPGFLPIPGLKVKPLVSKPVIKTPNKSLSFAPIQGKVVKLTRLKCSRNVSAEECDILIKGVFGGNCKYWCVGDLVGMDVGNDVRLDLIVEEINGKTREDCGNKELFKVDSGVASVVLNGGEMHEQFHPRWSAGEGRELCPPGLKTGWEKLCGGIRQALVGNWRCSGGRERQTEVWPSFLIHGGVGSGKMTLSQNAAAEFGLNFQVVNAVHLIGDSSAYTEAKLRAVFDKLKGSFCPVLVCVKNLHLVGKDKDGNEDKRVVVAFKEWLIDVSSVSISVTGGKDAMRSKAIVIVGCTDKPDALVPSISSCFPFKIELPSGFSTGFGVGSILEWFFKKERILLDEQLDLQSWAKKNSGGMQRHFGDVKALAANAVRNALKRLSRQKESCMVSSQSLKITREDLDDSLKTIDVVLKKAASAVEIPSVKWEDIGGMEDIKNELITSIKLPLEFPSMFSSGIRRSGILLYGPPGTGKTLVAKAVATEFKLSFLSVKGPELLNMYVGQSEQNVRDVFTKARNAAPCIIFFDELDALAPFRGRAGDSGGVMDRVVSQILAELDGTHSTPDVFIIGATNRPDLIDPALLRPGRFDKLLYVGIHEDVQSRTKILQALTRRFNLKDDVDLSHIASLLPKGMSGADIYSLCSDAYMTAVERHIFVEEKIKSSLDMHCDEANQSSVKVEHKDIEVCISRVTISLSKDELQRYEAMKQMKR